MSRQTWRVVLFAVASIVAAAGPAMGFSTYFAANCAGCHSNDTPTCIGCHHHGGAGGSPGTATTDKTQYAPGELVTVTLTGSSRGVWARALLYNQSSQEIARITGPTGTGDDGTQDPRLQFPFTLQAPAPTQPGTYTWDAAWWGSPFDSTNRVAFPHGPEVRRTTNQFTVVAVPVTGSVTINSGAAFTSSTAISLTLSVAGTGVTQMRFSNDTTATWSVWEPYATSKAWVLTSGDGPKTVYVQFGNSGGTVLAGANDSILLDTTAPTGSILINSGAASTSSPAVTLTLSATDTGSGVSQMRFRNDTTATWSAWQSYAASRGWILSPGTGTKTVFAQFRDGAGNTSVSSDSIVLNPSQPTGTLVINSGASFTNSTTVSLDLIVAGFAPTRMRFSNNNATYSPWEPNAVTKVWTLAAGDGFKTVYVQWGDDLGNVLASANDSITLDATPPTGSIRINSGTLYTTSTAATLALSATDAGSGVSGMRFSADGVSWGAWEAYAATKAWTLAGGSGSKTAYVQFRDAAGNASATFSDGIVLDATAPTGSIEIAGGAPWTAWPVVNLYLPASDSLSGVIDMHFSTNGVSWGAWEAYAANKTWTLAAGDGPHSIYVQYRDAAGNVSTAASDSIILDATGPTGSILINSGAAVTTSTAVVLTLSATDRGTSVTDMRFSTDGVAWGAWQPYAASRPWILVSGTGTRTVYVQFSDAAGNNSATYGDSIILGTGRPTGSVVINSGAAFTRSTAVTLSLSLTGGTATQVRFSSDGNIWGTWEPSVTSKAWTLPVGDGGKTVYVQWRDAGGNVLAEANASITLDTAPPTGSIVINHGAAATTSRNVTLTLSATDTWSGVSHMRFSDDGSTWSAWVPYSTSQTWTLTPGNGSKTVSVQFRDGAGNVSTTYRDTIQYSGPSSARNWPWYR